MTHLADLVIGFSGNIGVGKTTLTKAAASDELKHIMLSIIRDNPAATKDVTVLKEDVDKGFIKEFYANPGRYALAAQLSFFNARLIREHKAAVTQGIVLIDRPIQEDYHVFGKAQRILNNMTAGEFHVYEQNFRLLTQHIPPPDFYVYLKADVASLQQRIRQRALPEEQGLVNNPTYLETLNNLYEEFFHYHADAPVVEIDANQIRLGCMDKNYTKQVLEHIAHEVKTRTSSPKITSGFGKWLSYNPTEAVVESIKLENELREYLQDNKILISIAGNIGLGKTATARILAHGLGVEGSYELDPEGDAINDKLLSKFLGDKKKYCFDLQRHLLDKRIADRKRSYDKQVSCVEDRSPEEDPAVFHKLFHRQGLLSGGEYDRLQCESRQAYLNAPPSNLMIVLQGKAELSWSRIVQRSRPEELAGGWELEKDLRPLAEFYQDFPRTVQNYGLHKGPVILIDVNHVDITNRAHQGYVYEKIIQALDE
ncbi:deoxynucleoside kinase [Candidatus Woesearchaeota archaeon]|jgi:deoxyadenosine/deoxycytidine kinase|nr:deoxynucleoside kinase [Candidatus Woesearchaeota archaeon]